MNLEKYFIQAAKLALTDVEKKDWLHAAVGIRTDGAVVYARNHTVAIPTPSAHAETRLIRKLDKGAPLVIVVRVDKQGVWKMSKPCRNCQTALKNKGVRRVLYTTGDGEWDQMKF